MPSQQNTGTITAATSKIVWPATGTGFGTDPFALIQLSGTYAGIQMAIQGSLDGTNYTNIPAARFDLPSLEWGTISPQDNTTRVWQVPVGCLANLQVAASAWTSGTGNIRIASTPTSMLPYPSSMLSTTADAGEYSYGAAFYGLVAPASCTDLASITGSATRTIKVKKVFINGAATAAATCPMSLQVYSTANTGGTPAVTFGLPVVTPLDTNGPAATATVKSWTAVPTLGTLVGQIYAAELIVTTLTTPTPANILTVDLTSLFGPNGVVLRGTAQQLSINLGVSSPGAGNVFAGGWAWTES